MKTFCGFINELNELSTIWNSKMPKFNVGDYVYFVNNHHTYGPAKILKVESEIIKTINPEDGQTKYLTIFNYKLEGIENLSCSERFLKYNYEFDAEKYNM